MRKKIRVMPKWLEVILEIIKVTVPALVVFATVYYLFKTFLENQHKLQVLKMRKENKSHSFPIKMQAYERLMLFCERITLSNLMLRVRSENQTAGGLRLAMMIAIQQEFEHNVSQQVYVSEELWKIITFAKNDTINLVNIVAKTVDENASSQELSKAIFNHLNEVKVTPLDKARSAIVQEASVYL